RDRHPPPRRLRRRRLVRPRPCQRRASVGHRTRPPAGVNRAGHHTRQCPSEKENQTMTASQHITTVGFIGLGDQGAAIARAIAEAGFELHAWARNARSLDALDGVRYVAHESPAELGAVSDIVGLCLNVDDNVRDIMTKGGLLAAMRPGSVLVNQGTGLPAFALEMTRLAEDYGVDVLDAPVSGGHAGAVAKT